MNAQLQVELTKIITNINTGAETAWGFITEQTPEVVQQLLMWHGVKSFLDMTLPIFFLILSGLVFALTVKKAVEHINKETFSINVPIMVLSGISSIIFLVGSFANINFIWLQIWIAPKVWLLEYVAKMVK